MSNAIAIGIGLGGGIKQFSPTDLGGLTLWFDASSPTVYSDAGTTLATNTQTVQQWTDKSTSAKNLTQASAGLRPVYNTNVQNGLPIITFDGSDDVLQTAAMTLNQPEHIFIMFRQVSWTGNDRVWDGVSGLNAMTLYQRSATPQLGMYAGADAPNTTGLAVNTFGILDCLYSSSASTIRVNNGAKTTGDASTNNAGGFSLGADATLFQAGNIGVGEVLIYNVALSDANAAKVIRYLGTKWGVTIS